MTCKTALERAVNKNCSSIVYYLVKEYNQDISKLDQVRTSLCITVHNYVFDDAHFVIILICEITKLPTECTFCNIHWLLPT